LGADFAFRHTACPEPGSVGGLNVLDLFAENALLTAISNVGVIPVVTIDDAAKAPNLARALCAGGLNVIEIVLRTPEALNCVRAIRDEVPECVVGVGTVVRPSDIVDGYEAGAMFAVSPGFTPDLLAAGLEAPVPYLPAVCTPAEVLQVMSAGYDLMKFFPAELMGGVEALKALSGPFPSVKFCCTGGIPQNKLALYREQSNVAAVGASFMAPKGAIEAADWRLIEDLARDARAHWEGRASVISPWDASPVRRKAAGKPSILRSAKV